MRQSAKLGWLVGLAQISLVTIAIQCSSPSARPPVLDDTSSSGDKGGGSTDASTVDAAYTAPGVLACGLESDGGAPDAAGACNAIPCGPYVTAENVAAAVPSATGGTISPGTYALTALNIYQGIGGTAGPADLVVQASYHYDGTNYDEVQSSGTPDGGIGPVIRISGTYSTSGAGLDLNATCGGTAGGVSFTAAPHVVTHYTGNMEFIYTLQSQ